MLRASRLNSSQISYSFKKMKTRLRQFPVKKAILFMYLQMKCLLLQDISDLLLNAKGVFMPSCTHNFSHVPDVTLFALHVYS